MFSAASVCLFVRMITRDTSKRLTVGWWNLVVRCIVQKSRPSLNVKVRGQDHHGQTEKCGRFSGAILWGTVLCGAPHGRGCAGAKISTCSLVSFSTSYILWKHGYERALCMCSLSMWFSGWLRCSYIPFIMIICPVIDLTHSNEYQKDDWQTLHIKHVSWLCATKQYSE